MSKYEVVNRTGGIEIGGTTLYGMDAEHALKQASKYDYGRERDILEWIEAAVGEKMPSRDFHESLKSGVVLCKLVNKIRPGIVAKYNTRPIALMEMENIKLYLEACWKLGVPSSALFINSDLYKQRGMNEVLNNLEALSKLAARMKSYTGPVLQIHERERSGYSGDATPNISTSSNAPNISTSAQPVKKWKPIEMGGPVYSFQGQNPEDVDIRSENFKLKQLLEREKFDRERAEAELAKLKASPASTPVSSPAPVPVAAAAAASNNKENEQWAAKVKNLESQVKDLEAKIATLNKQATASSSVEADLRKIKASLEDEKRIRLSTEKDLQREKEGTGRLQKEIENLKKQVADLQKKNQGGAAAAVVASPVAAPSKANQSELDEKTKQIAELKRVENLLREENQKLLILNNQLKKDLDFALQINEQNNKTQRRVKNYFFIDEAVDTEASEEIKRVEQCLSAILRSQEVEFSNVFELNEFFKIDSGRRKFTQMLEKEMIDGPNNRVLSQSSFELLLFLINTTLTEMDVSDSSDLITAKILMRAASIFKRIIDGQDEYILTFINQYSVYHDINFWEELFWDELFELHKNRGFGEEELYTLDHSLTTTALDDTITVMLKWQSTKEEVTRFAYYIFSTTKTPEESVNVFLKQMVPDTFWDLNSRTGTPKKKSGSRIAGRDSGSRRDKKKTGSRIRS